MLLLLLACTLDPTTTKPGPGTGTTTPSLPDPAFVFEVDGRVETGLDEPFDADLPTLWRGPELQAVALDGGVVYAGGPSGRYRVEGEALVQLDAEPVVDLLPGVVAREDAVEIAGARFPLAGITALAGTAADLYAATATGTQHLGAAGDWTSLSARAAVDLAVVDGSLWEASSDGLWHDGVRVDGLPDEDVRAVAIDAAGHAWAASATGLWAEAGTGGGPAETLLPGVDGLPTGDLTALDVQGDTVLIGHTQGATRRGLVDSAHFHGLRWLPGDTVHDVALDDGEAWIATSGGLARITPTSTLLSERAARLEAALDAYWRLDFAADSGWRSDPWSGDALTLWDFDNDGLWTSMQIAAWSFAAKATGDASYCESARRAENAMRLEVAIPAVSFAAAGRPTGFVARSLVRDDEPDLWAVHSVEPNWHLVEDVEGHDWLWKDDTSSDETTGHFFGTPVYYDLCATEEEKAEIASRLGALAGVIVDDGFVLTDLDGARTTWGYWDPAHVAIALDGLEACFESFPAEDCIGAAYGAGWLQALEILGHLLAAWHVTGDPRFYEAYEQLVVDERYAEVIDWSDDNLVVTNPSLANHSDHELAMLAYFTLIRYEPDDARRLRWIDSLQGFYAWEREERNPLWAAVVASAVREGYDLESAQRTLREMPEDRREWRMDNSHRADATVTSYDRFDEAQFDRVLPYGEIRTMKWNGNPYVVAGGGDGSTEQGPWPWLLPYWMLRSQGAIVGVGD